MGLYIALSFVGCLNFVGYFASSFETVDSAPRLLFDKTLALSRSILVGLYLSLIFVGSLNFDRRLPSSTSLVDDARRLLVDKTLLFLRSFLVGLYLSLILEGNLNFDEVKSWRLADGFAILGSYLGIFESIFAFINV